MNIYLSDEEMELLREARAKGDWHGLIGKKHEAKLLFTYQRYIAMPTNDMNAVHTIAEIAWRKMNNYDYQDIIKGEVDAVAIRKARFDKTYKERQEAERFAMEAEEILREGGKPDAKPEQLPIQ